MTKTDLIKNHCKELNISALPANIDLVVAAAETHKVSYLELIKTLPGKERQYRKSKEMEKRTKMTRLPLEYNLDNFDHAFSGFEKKQLNQLRKLSWLKQNFNVILMGLSGTR